MHIKVKTYILDRKPCDIVKPGDRYYEDFKNWAVKKSTRNGAVICEPCDMSEKVEQPMTTSSEPLEDSNPTGYIRSDKDEEPTDAPADPGDTSWKGEKRMKSVRDIKNGTSKGKAE